MYFICKYVYKAIQGDYSQFMVTLTDAVLDPAWQVTVTVFLLELVGLVGMYVKLLFLLYMVELLEERPVL